MATKCLVKLFPNFIYAKSKPLLSCSIKSHLKILSANYAAPKKAASGPGGVKKKLNIEVETDAEVLCSRLVGGNIYKEGEDPVLGPDEDYPDWLWNLHIDRQAIPLEELSEDDPKYWKKLKIMNIRVNNRHRAAKKGV